VSGYYLYILVTDYSGYILLARRETRHRYEDTWIAPGSNQDACTVLLLRRLHRTAIELLACRETRNRKTPGLRPAAIKTLAPYCYRDACTVLLSTHLSSTVPAYLAAAGSAMTDQLFLPATTFFHRRHSSIDGVLPPDDVLQVEHCAEATYETLHGYAERHSSLHDSVEAPEPGRDCTSRRR